MQKWPIGEQTKESKIIILTGGNRKCLNENEFNDNEYRLTVVVIAAYECVPLCAICVCTTPKNVIATF